MEKTPPVNSSDPASPGRSATCWGAAQTGSGKTAAFALQFEPFGVRSEAGSQVWCWFHGGLAVQVTETFQSLSQFTRFKVATIVGGVGYDQQRKAVSDGVDVVVATPGRLLDHLQNRAFTLARVDHLVLDEADRMLDMGFLPDIKSIIHRVPTDRQTLLFSATLVPEVERIAAFALKDPLRIEVARPATVAEGISQILYPVIQEQKQPTC
ncbi:MAG: DEAD/DEAH box helicase [Elusimicrobia bacterium]|nr:DEAD/DEAH box helicase [Elusimicrobiota bacterium]